MDKILSILNEARPEFDFALTANFIDNGMLDSFDIITVVTDLEEAFAIRIDGIDIVPENFDSVDAIKQLVLKYGGKDESQI